jgi:hypothetical protein
LSLTLILPGNRMNRKNNSINGAIAQLGERLHGMQEVGGSIPPGSTSPFIVPGL